MKFLLYISNPTFHITINRSKLCPIKEKKERKKKRKKNVTSSLAWLNPSEFPPGAVWTQADLLSIPKWFLRRVCISNHQGKHFTTAEKINPHFVVKQK